MNIEYNEGMEGSRRSREGGDGGEEEEKEEMKEKEHTKEGYIEIEEVIGARRKGESGSEREKGGEKGKAGRGNEVRERRVM